MINSSRRNKSNNNKSVKKKQTIHNQQKKVRLSFPFQKKKKWNTKIDTQLDVTLAAAGGGDADLF